MRKRRVRLNNNIPLLKPLRDVGSIQPRMKLVLTDVDFRAGSSFTGNVGLEFIEMVHAVV